MQTPPLKTKKGARRSASRGPGLSTVKLKPVRGRAFRPKKPEGGKALARIQQFRLERGFPLLDLQDPSPQESPVKAVRRRTGAAGSAKNKGAVSTPYLEAFRAVAKMPSDLMGPASAVPKGWRPLGPYSVPHGQTYGSGPGSRPPVAGRIAGIDIDPFNPDHLLCGAAGGGVWETRDGGATWH